MLTFYENPCAAIDACGRIGSKRGSRISEDTEMEGEYRAPELLFDVVEQIARRRNRKGSKASGAGNNRKSHT